MLNNRIKRNIWMIMSIIMAVIVIERSIRLIKGGVEWWEPLSACAIGAVCVKIFLSYRKAVKHGNLYGVVKPFK